jgi:hypothetical protein
MLLPFGGYFWVRGIAKHSVLARLVSGNQLRHLQKDKVADALEFNDA